MRSSLRGVHDRLVWGLWLALLMGIPITSFPLLSQGSGGETPVGPISLLPLAALVAVWLVPRLLRGDPLPGLSRPLFLFGLVALISALIAVFLPIVPYKGQMVFGREVRALGTLAIGLAFYLCASLLPDTEARRKQSLRAIHIGATATLAWSSVQAWVVLSGRPRVPLVVTQIHHWFSVRDPLVDRVTGLAYEPSWLGHQLAVLYVPLLLSAVLRRHSVFPWGKGWFSLEAVLLIWSAVVLGLTRARISQVGFLIIVTLVVLTYGWRALRWAQRRLGLEGSSSSGVRRGVLRAATVALLLTVVAGLLLGAAAAASRLDARLWALPSIRDWVGEAAFLYPNDVGFALADRLAFAERVVYWTAAFRTFALYPLLGVGPGNFGFFFEDTLPAYGFRLIEVQDLIREPSFGFPNPKNLWLRVLSETGVVGFVPFLLWFLSVALGAAVLARRGAAFEQVLGSAGLLASVTLLVEGFSLDTFALPTLWLIPGLVTAALWRSPLLGRGAGALQGPDLERALGRPEAPKASSAASRALPAAPAGDGS